MKKFAKVPIAFSIIAHNNLAMLEILLESLYRPGHSICMHVDAKADQNFHASVQDLVHCYNRRFPRASVFIVEKPVSVYWGHISLLQADLTCLESLLEINSAWKYYMNLAGNELPAMKVEDIEKMVGILNETSLSHGDVMPQKFSDRIKSVYVLDVDSRRDKISTAAVKFSHMTKTLLRKSRSPFNLTIFKGVKNVVLSRPTAEFVLHHPVAKALYRWLENTLIPDESFYTTLTRTRVTGEGKDFEVSQNMDILPEPFMSRYTDWWPNESQNDPGSKRCHGLIQREICQFSIWDLDRIIRDLKTKPHLILNKFNLTMDPLAVACWTERTLL